MLQHLPSRIRDAIARPNARRAHALALGLTPWLSPGERVLDIGAGHGFALDGFDQEVFMNGAMVGSPLSTTFKIDEPGRYNFYCSTQCSTTDLHPHMHGTLVVE